MALAPRPVSFSAPVAVVIDVLRFSTTAAVAMHAGVAKIHACASAQEALAQRQPGELLAGEKQGKRIEGFEFGNSPASFAREDVAGKSFRFVTSNGVPACLQLQDRSLVLLASFANRQAVAGLLVQRGEDCLLFCSGRKGGFCAEDAAFAGALLESMLVIAQETGSVSLHLSSQAKLALAIWQAHEKNAQALLLRCSWGQRLLELGLKEDILLASRMDWIDAIPVFREGVIVRGSF